MKLTWFGNGSFRVHAGGRIVVVAPGAAPEGVSRAELVSGADLVVEEGEALAEADGRSWKARPAGRLLDAEAEPGPAQVFSLGAGALLIAAEGERPLLVLEGPAPALGRWVERAVVGIAGDGRAARAAMLAERFWRWRARKPRWRLPLRRCATRWRGPGWWRWSAAWRWKSRRRDRARRGRCCISIVIWRGALLITRQDAIVCWSLP